MSIGLSSPFFEKDPTSVLSLVSNSVAKPPKMSQSQSDQHGSFTSCLFLLCTAAFGTGVLTLPYALRNAGLVFGLLFFTLASFFAGISNLYLAKLAQKYGCQSYGDLIAAVVGNRYSGDKLSDGSNTISNTITELLLPRRYSSIKNEPLPLSARLIICSFDLLMYVYTLAAVISYMMFLSDFISQLLEFVGLNGSSESDGTVPGATSGLTLHSLTLFLNSTLLSSSSSFSVSDRTVLIVLIAIIVFPFCLIEKITELKFLSTFSISSLGFVCVVVVYKAVLAAIGSNSNSTSDSTSATVSGRLGEVVWLNSSDSSDASSKSTSDVTTEVSTALNSFAVIIFAYVNQCCSIPIFYELPPSENPQKTAQNMSKLAASFSVVLTILYLLVALSVVYQFGEDTQANFLKNYSETDSLIVICRGMLIIMLLLAIVLNVFPCLQAFFRFYKGVIGGYNSDSRVGFGARCLMTAVSLGFCTTVSCLTTNIAGVIGLASSLFASLLSMGIPGYLYITMFLEGSALSATLGSSLSALILCGVTVLLWGNTVKDKFV